MAQIAGARFIDRTATQSCFATNLGVWLITSRRALIETAAIDRQPDHSEKSGR